MITHPTILLFNRLLSSHRELLAALRSAGECRILSTLEETLHHSQEAPSTKDLNICAQVQDVKVDVRIDSIIRHSELSTADHSV